MIRITQQDRKKIERVRKKKERTMAKMKEILRDICKDNPDIFKKTPDGRVKNLKSIEDKIKNQECNISTFEKTIRDIAGVRVTCCTSDEIPQAETLITKHPEVKKCKVLRRYDEGPDEDGYRGHHLEIAVHIFYKNKTIKDFCEVQIRTLAADLWAVLSHRDFYKSPTKPPPSVRRDMLTLGKQLEVVDELALSLKQRIREEINKEARVRAKPRVAEKDMLTPDNVKKLIYKILRKKISVDFAYEMIQYALLHNVTSLKEYKRLITESKYRNMVDDIFNRLGVKPQLKDYLCVPIYMKSAGIRAGHKVLHERARRLYEKTIAYVEKGIEIPKEKLEKEVKISKPKDRRKKR